MGAATFDPLVSDLHRSIEQHKMLTPAPGRRECVLVVGVSGGLDSVCLAHLLHALTAELHLILHLAHVDHGLRPESAADALFVARLAAELDTPFHQTRLDADALRVAPSGMEAAARQARYGFLRQVARQIAPSGQTPIIAVAHHADDQAETVLLHLTRGSGVHGLAGMRRVTEWLAEDGAGPAVRVLRPLLSVRRAHLHAYAARQGLRWCEDETNQDVAFARNRLRHLVLPQLASINPAAVENICRSADTLAGVAQQLSQMDDGLLAAFTLEDEPGQRIVLDLERLKRISAPQRRSLLHSALRRTFPHLREVGFSHIEQIERAVAEGKPTGGPHPVVEELAWTVGVAPSRVGERSQRPPWLSLHTRHLLPLRLAHPWLDAVGGSGPPTFLPLPGEFVAPGGWALQVEEHALNPQQLLPVTCDPWQAWLDADRCGPLLLTTPTPGMRISPLGLAGGRKSLGDFFTDRKLPSALRVGWPLVVNTHTRDVVWVCGFTIGEGAALRVNSRRALHLAWRVRQE